MLLHVCKYTNVCEDICDVKFIIRLCINIVFHKWYNYFICLFQIPTQLLEGGKKKLFTCTKSSDFFSQSTFQNKVMQSALQQKHIIQVNKI